MANRQMRKARSVAADLMLGLCAMGSTAHAGSRFEIGDEAPATTSVHLDFTIVIPAIMTLRLDRGGDAANAETAQWAQKGSALPLVPADAAALPIGKIEVLASSNAGTLAATAPASSRETTGVALDTHPAIFLVALP